MNIEIKILHKDAVVPEYATANAAGLDLLAMTDHTLSIPPLKTVMVGTGIAINMSTIPHNLMAMIVPRSGKGAKECKVLGNLVGIIDKDYQGELKLSIWNRNAEEYIEVKHKEAIAQLIFVPVIAARLNMVEEFSTVTDRGAGGFGSTDLGK